MPTLVHLIYVHGFQGNDTTFQSFPKHLQEYLAARTPAHLDIKFQSSLYPTYRSVKPISYATKNFLEWLGTQPPGPVILLGHSMGGLLVADAATHASNNWPGGKPKRIIGVIAFDTPYLGMHPHVVITGIASLLPKGEEEKKEGTGDEGKMNDHPQVNVVDEKVTDDWEAFKKQEHIRPNRQSHESSSSYSSHSLSAPPRSPSPLPSTLTDRALGFIAARADEPVVRWLRKHADDPFSASKRWVIERFQFGACMFDPAGLKDRYETLVEWHEQGGKWVNYWTETVPRVPTLRDGEETPRGSGVSSGSSGEARKIDNDQALATNGIVPPSQSQSHTQEEASKSQNPSSLPDKSKEEEVLDKSQKAEAETLEPPPPYASTSAPTSPSTSAPTTTTEDNASALSETQPELEPPVHSAATKSEFKAAQKQAAKEVKDAENRVKQDQKEAQKASENQAKAEKKAKENQAKAEQKAVKDAESTAKAEQKALANQAKTEQKAKQQAAKEAENAAKAEQKSQEKAAKDVENAAKAERKAREKAEKARLKALKPKPARHFVVLPNGIGDFLGGFDYWSKVPIEGVDDEVAAHLGLFIPEHNLGYEGLVQDVGGKVFGWCEELPKAIGSS